MTTTTPVRQPLDTEKLLSYIYTTVLPHEVSSSSLAPLSQYHLDIHQFSHGQSNPTYLLTITQFPTSSTSTSISTTSKINSTTIQYVLRKKPSNNVLATAHAIDREYRIMKALSLVPNFPVPRMIHYESSSTTLNSSFYLMNYVQGQIFTDPTLSHIASIRDRQQVYEAMINTLVKLHNINPQTIHLQDYGPQVTLDKISTLGFYSRQIRRLTQVSNEQAKHAPPLPYLEEVMEWFTNQVIERDKDGIPSSIIHGDYKLDNLIFSSLSSSSTLQVIAVLDWEMSTLGHPLSDLANMCGVYYVPVAEPSSNTGFSGLLGANLGWNETGIPTEGELVEIYCKKMNIPYPLQGWDFYMAFWFFKYATIAQGVAARANQGIASSAYAKKVGKMAPLLMELCIERIRSSTKLI